MAKTVNVGAASVAITPEITADFEQRLAAGVKGATDKMSTKEVEEKFTISGGHAGASFGQMFAQGGLLNAGTGGALAGAYFATQFIDRARSALGSFASDPVQFFGQGLELIGLALGGPIGLAIGAAIGGGIEAFLNLGGQFHESMKIIRVETGATGAELKAFTDEAKTLFGELPVSLKDASTAVGELVQRLGLTGPQLDAVAVQFLNLSRLTGTDVSANIKAVAGLFNQFNVAADDQARVLDELFVAYQKTGISVAELAQSAARSGGPLQLLGLTLEQVVGLTASFAKNGLDADAILNGLTKTLRSIGTEGVAAVKDAEQAEKDQASALREVESATTAVVRANRSYRLAQEELTRLQSGGIAREQADAQRSIADAIQAQADANQSVLDAEEKLAEARRGPSELDQLKAQVALEKARNDAARSANEQTDAERALRDELQYGDPGRIADAQQRLNDAKMHAREATLALAEAEAKANGAGQEQADAVAKAQRDLQDAQRRQADAAQRVEDARQRARDKLGDDLSGQNLLRDAQDKLTIAADNVASAQDRVTAAEAKLKDTTDIVTAQDAIRDALSKLPESATALDKVQAIFDLISNTSDPTLAAAEAARIFGRDAGPKLAEAIKSGKVDLNNLQSDFESAGGAIGSAGKDTDDWHTKWTNFIHLLETKLEPIATRVFNGITNWLTDHQADLDKFGDWVGKIVDTILTAYNAGGIDAVLQVMFNGVASFYNTTVRPWLVTNIPKIVSSMMKEIAKAAIAAVTDIASNPDTWASLIENLGSLPLDIGSGIVSGIAGAFGFANGTPDNPTSQWAWVGERGPELVQLPKGAAVYQHGVLPSEYRDDVMRKLGGGAGQGGTSKTTNVYVAGRAQADLDAQDIMRALRAGEALAGAVA